MVPREDFIAHELPRVLQVAREQDALQELSCVLLYGSANYRSYGEAHSIPVGGDYDCWVFFRRGAVEAVRRYSDFLLARGRRMLKRPLRQAVLLYEKIPSRHAGRILAPFITTEDVMDDVLAAHRGGVLRREFVKRLPWYRLTPRQHALRVPATAFDGKRTSLELLQRYAKTHALWRLEAPAFAVKAHRYCLSFTVEAFLTSAAVYGARSGTALKLAELARVIARRAQDEIPTADSADRQAELIYNTFTIAKKAPAVFREACTECLARWISQ